MTEKSYPFVGSPAATEFDWRVLAQLLGGIDGVLSDDATSTALKVTATGGTSLNVSVGQAIANGFVYWTDTTVSVTAPTNAGSGVARQDRLVLRSSQAGNAVTLVAKTGGVSPPALTRDRDGIWEVSLARYTMPANSTIPGSVVDERSFYGKGTCVSLSGARRDPVRGQLIVEGSGSEPTLLIGTGTDWVQIWPGATGAFGHIGRTSGFQGISGSGAFVGMAAQDLTGGFTIGGGSPSGLVVPKTGRYRIFARPYFTDSDAYYGTWAVVRNSTAVPHNYSNELLWGRMWKQGGFDHTHFGSVKRYLNAGDVVRLWMSGAQTWGTDGFNGSWLEMDFDG